MRPWFLFVSAALSAMSLGVFLTTDKVSSWWMLAIAANAVIDFAHEIEKGTKP